MRRSVEFVRAPRPNQERDVTLFGVHMSSLAERRADHVPGVTPARFGAALRGYESACHSQQSDFAATVRAKFFKATLRKKIFLRRRCAKKPITG